MQKDLGSRLLGNYNFSYAPLVLSIKDPDSRYREKLLGMSMLTSTAVNVVRILEHYIRGPNTGARSVLFVTDTKSELHYLKLG